MAQISTKMGLGGTIVNKQARRRTNKRSLDPTEQKLRRIHFVERALIYKQQKQNIQKQIREPEFIPHLSKHFDSTAGCDPQMFA